MISPTITQKIGEALKAHDGVKLSTLRLLSSAFNYERIAKQHELTEEEELVVVRREAKKRREASEAYRKASALDRAEKEEAELKILQEFLPPEISDIDLEKLVDEAIIQTSASSLSDMGKVMSLVKGKTQGAADGAKIADLVKHKLNLS